MSTLKANAYQHVDRGSPSIIIQSDGSVSISSTVTYEDVTSVDAVGVITGRSNADLQNRVNVGSGVSINAGGLNVTAGISTFGGTSTFNDDVVLAGASYNVSWDKSQNYLQWADNAKAVFGASADLEIYHSGSNSFIKQTGTGDLYLQCDSGEDIYLRPKVNEDGVKVISDGAVELYHNNTKRLTTTTSGISVSDELNVVGLTTIGGDVSVSDKIIHTGDTNTAIRFPSADIVTVETGGTERTRVSDLGLRIGTNSVTANTAGDDVVVEGSSDRGISIISGTSSSGNIYFGDSGDADIGRIAYQHTDNALQVYTNASGSANIIIDSSGRLYLGTSTVYAATGGGNMMVSITKDATSRTDLSISNQSTGDNAGAALVLAAHGQDFILESTGSGNSTTGAGVFTISDGASERLRIDASGRLLLGTTTTGAAQLDTLTINTNSHTGITIRSGTSSNGHIGFADGTSGNAQYRGFIKYEHTGDRLTIATADAAALYINSSQNSQFTGIVTATSFVPTTIQTSYKNLIVNGDMNVAQRGTASTSDVQGYTTVDRMKVGWGGADSIIESRQGDLASSDTGPWAAGFRHAYYLVNGNQNGGAQSGDHAYIEYTIEAQDIANSGWDYTNTSSYLTLSYWVKSSVAQTFYGYLYTYDGSSQTLSHSTGALSANTWTKVTLKIPGHANLQFDNNNSAGLTIYWWPYCGTDRTTSGNTLNAWQAYASANRMPDNTSTWWTTNDATFWLTGIQLEVGSEPTPFEHISFPAQLQRCKRYYNAFGIDGSGTGAGAGYMLLSGGYAKFGGATSLAFNRVFYDVQMRTTPTVKYGRNAANDDMVIMRWSDLGSNPTLTLNSSEGANSNGFHPTLYNSTAGQTYDEGKWFIHSFTKFRADAEL